MGFSIIRREAYYGRKGGSGQWQFYPAEQAAFGSVVFSVNLIRYLSRDAIGMIYVTPAVAAHHRQQ